MLWEYILSICMGFSWVLTLEGQRFSSAKQHCKKHLSQLKVKGGCESVGLERACLCLCRINHVAEEHTSFWLFPVYFLLEQLNAYINGSKVLITAVSWTKRGWAASLQAGEGSWRHPAGLAGGGTSPRACAEMRWCSSTGFAGVWQRSRMGDASMCGKCLGRNWII